MPPGIIVSPGRRVSTRQPRGLVVAQRLLGAEAVADADRLQGAAGEAHDRLGRLVAVELQDVEADLLRDARHLLRGGVDEDPDPQHERRQVAAMAAAFSASIRPRAHGPEHEADGVGPRLDGRGRASAARVMPQIFTKTRAAIRPPCSSRAGARPGRAGVGRAHEVLADEERVEAGAAQAPHVVAGGDAALRHRDHVVGDGGREAERGLQVDGQGLEVAVVDAHDRAADGEGAIELLAVVDLDQGVEAGLLGGLGELAQLGIREGGHDQEDGVGAGDPRLPDLVGIDDEVLAQDGQQGGGTGPPQVLE